MIEVERLNLESRAYQLLQVEDQIDTFSSFSQFQEEKNRNLTYADFLVDMAENLNCTTLQTGWKSTTRTTPLVTRTYLPQSSVSLKDVRQIRKRAETPGDEFYLKRHSKKAVHIMGTTTSKSNKRATRKNMRSLLPFMWT